MPALHVSHNLTPQQRAEARAFEDVRQDAWVGHKVELVCFPDVYMRIDGCMCTTPAAARAFIDKAEEAANCSTPY